MSARIGLLTIALTLFATACGATRFIQDRQETSPERLMPAPAATSAPAAAARQDAPATKPAAAPAPANQSASVPSTSLPSIDRMIIRTVTMTLTVSNVGDAYRQIENLAGEMGGMVATSSFKQEGDRTVGSVTLRVPADQRTYATTLERLRSISTRVEEESVSSQDVTEEYVDLESSLRNLQATEVRLLSLLERASKIEDIIAIQRELTNVRGQIERIEGRRRFLERRSDFTTITLTLRDAAVSTRAAWDPVETAREAFRALLVTFQGIGRAAIWLGIWFPIYGIPMAIAWWVIRQARRRRVTA